MMSGSEKDRMSAIVGDVAQRSQRSMWKDPPDRLHPVPWHFSQVGTWSTSRSWHGPQRWTVWVSA